MIEPVVRLAIQHWTSLAVLLVAVWSARNRYKHGLNRYHGPFLASLSDWWRFFDVYGRRPETTHRRLHAEHGNIVRLGPNYLSFADPKALKAIYGPNKGFYKSEFYPVQQALSKGERLPSLFSTTDEVYHAQLRRSVNSAFSMSALVQYEPSVDIVLEQFLNQTQKLYAGEDTVVDFGEWLQFYAFDVIGQITYSKTHGFVDRAEDVDGIVGHLSWLFSYVAPVGQIPILDLVFLKNPLVRLLAKFNIYNSSFAVVKFAQARMAERLSSQSEVKVEERSDESDASTVTPKREDLLSQFLKAKTEHPEFFHDGRVLVMAVSMAFAGSETTGISLSSVFYFLLKNTRCLKKLQEELESGIREGRICDLENGITSWAEAQSLPYLDAVVKESFRLHPAVGLPLERVTPAQGAMICGEFIPGGTIVGCSAWVIHHRPEIFGDDHDEFKPERWLECSEDKRKEMDGHLFQFGMGSRTCIGKNISLLEIYKLVPSFLRRFDVELADPSSEWKIHNAWFVKQLNFYAKFHAKVSRTERSKWRP